MGAMEKSSNMAYILRLYDALVALDLLVPPDGAPELADSDPLLSGSGAGSARAGWVSTKAEFAAPRAALWAWVEQHQLAGPQDTVHGHWVSTPARPRAHARTHTRAARCKT